MEYKFKVTEQLILRKKVCSKQIRKEMLKLDNFGYDFKTFQQAKFDLQAKGKSILEHESLRIHSIYAEDNQTAEVRLLKRLQKEGFSLHFKKKIMESSLIPEIIKNKYITNTFLTLVK